MATSKRPNILFITSDQHHWSSVGFQNPEVKTPNLDRLAKQGIIFDRAYCPNPTCTPTRASIITGMYPSQHGAYALGTKLPETVHTVGQDFQGANYRTALVGKAHFQQLKTTEDYPSLESVGIMQDLDFWRKFNEDFYGFDHVELARGHADEHLVGQHYAIWMEEHGFNWRDHFRKPTGNSEPQLHKWSIPEQYHPDAWIAERTNALLDQYTQNDEPFFLWSSFFDPHPQYLIPEPWDTMYDPEKITVPTITPGEHDNNPPHFAMTQEEHPDFSAWNEPEGNSMHGMHSHLSTPELRAKNLAVYYGMVSMMDKYIGKILDKLEALGQADNTIVVFTTDHGHLFGQHGLNAKCPFHYEDLLKVPFVARTPNQKNTGTRSDALISLVDLAPSFLTACDIPVPRCMTGINQMDVLDGKQERIRDHVLVENRHQPTTLNIRTFVDARYKLTIYYNRPYGELFDLEKDPNEKHNLWNDPASAELKAELMHKFLFAEMAKDPLPMPRVCSA